MISKSAVAAFIVAALAVGSSSAFTLTPASRPVAWGTSASHSGLHMSTVVAGTEAFATYEKNVEKMRAKDKTSKALSKEDLNVVHEDEHIVVIDKPAGVLCVPDKAGNPSLAAAVFEAFGCESGNMDKMVAQRLGFDTSGLIVFAKTDKAVSALNMSLRTRKMVRKYEALLCGNVSEDAGTIDFTLTRDANALPYMRVFTEDSQKDLIGLMSDRPPELDKSLFRNEQPSLTRYQVVGREELGGHPVTRVTLTSVSGRTHQLNVHCAAFGHPIAGDSVYGAQGDASPNGGFSEEEMNERAPNRATVELQQNIASAAKGLCVHLKELSFKHPVTKEIMSFESKAPF